MLSYITLINSVSSTEATPIDTEKNTEETTVD